MIRLLRKNVTYYHASSCHPSPIPTSAPLRLFSTRSKSTASPAILRLLLHKFQFSPEVASKAASVLSGVKDPQRSDSILLYLKDAGFSNAQLEKMVRYLPRLLSARLEDSIKPKITTFQDMGFRSDDIARIISDNPIILQLNLSTRVIPSFSTLKALLGSDDAVTKLLRRCGWFLIHDIHRTMVPNIEFLKNWGIPTERILRLLNLYPRSLLLNPNVISECAEKAEAMGVNRSSNMFIYALPILCTISDKAWELKLQALQKCGFSESDVMTMFAKFPPIFLKSVHKLNRVKDVVLATGKYDLSCIVHNPMSFIYSIEKRYKPRFRVLVILERKNLIRTWPTLSTFCSMSDEKFFKKFVGPYLSEVGQVYIAEGSVMAKEKKS